VAEEKLGIWVISVVGATLKKVRDDGRGAAFSPDGSQIVFVDGSTRQPWIMNADGSNPRLFAKLEGGFIAFSPNFFPYGKRIAYIKYRHNADRTELVLESRDLKGEDPVVLFASPQIADFIFAQPGRIILNQNELPPNQYDSNLWEIHFDPESGKPKGGPRRLTDWTGFSFSNPRMTADHQRLVFMRDHAQSDVYIGDLSKGKDFSPQRLTLNDRLDWPTGWLNPKTVLFYSDRSGTFDVYKQAVDQHDAESVVAGPDDKWGPQVTPDGKWLLFLQWAKSAPGSTPPPGKLMRVPVGGGPAETVFEVKGHPPNEAGFILATVGGYPSFACPKHGQGSCILAEDVEKNVVFTSFDATQGRQKEVSRVKTDPDFVAWDLSPEGDRIAASTFDYKVADVQVLPVAGGEAHKLSALPWKELTTISWAADGKSLLTVSTASRGDSLLRVDLASHPQLVFKWPSVQVASLSPSPDGHYVAIGAAIDDSNAWMIDAFPEK
jgi:hypothetical protein